MLIFRLKPGVVCSPDAPLRLCDVASGLCDVGYEDIMALPVHAPSCESYTIDALDVTRAISAAYPKLRVEMRGLLSSRVCPIKASIFQIGAQPSPNVRINSAGGGGMPKCASSPSGRTYAPSKPAKPAIPAEKEGFFSRIKKWFLNGGFSMGNAYQQIPRYALDREPRPGDREERLKSMATWDTRNKQEVEDNATKEP